MYKVVPEEIWDLALRKMEELTLIHGRTDDEMDEFRAWALLLKHGSFNGGIKEDNGRH